MQAAQHIAYGARVIVLHEMQVEAGSGEFTRLPYFTKKTPVVTKAARLDQDDFWDSQALKFERHGR